MAWGNIMEVNVGDANNPVNRNMLTNHGEISSDKCKATSATYLNTDSRRAQNNYQLYLCLTKSVDADTIEKMSDESEKYTVTIPGANNAPATTHSCGVCYLKLLLAKAEVDNKAVASHVRTNLSKLDQYMVSEAKSNITKFNEYVRKQLRILSQRGEESSDTLTNLFKGYLACNDKDFVADIKRIKRDHDFGERELTPKTLMDRAQEMYDTAGLEETWEELTEEQQELVALRAELEAMRKDGKKKQEGGKKPTKESKKKKPTKKGKATFKGKWAWRKVKPKQGEKLTKKFEGETWDWCEHHGYWCKHTTADCEKFKNEQKKKNSSADASNITAAMAQLGIEDVVEESE
jgi:hypothetical protein